MIDEVGSREPGVAQRETSPLRGGQGGRLTALAAATLLGVGCSVARVQLPEPVVDGVVTIFVPGYRATQLFDADSRKRAWVSPSDITGFNRKSLARSFEGMDELTRYERIAVGPPLTRVSVLRGLIDVEVYGEFLKWAPQNLPGFTAFAYDWRQDIRQSARELCALKDALIAKHGEDTKVRFVAHSMGGLVSLHCLLSNPRGVDRIAFMGTPFRGAAGIFDDLIEGTPLFFNRNLVSKEALFTFDAAWQLLPRQSDFIVDPEGRPAPIDAYTVETWTRYRLGVFEQPHRVTSGAYLAQFKRLMAAHEEHHAALANASSFEGLRTFAVIGTGRPTPSGWRVKGGALTIDGPLEADGDSTVVTTSAAPFPWLQAKTMQTTAEHVEMVRAPEVQAAVKAFLEAE